MINVIENKETGRIIIGECEIEGFIDEKLCPICSQNKVYYDDYDSFFCPQCNIWFDSKCGDLTCDFCRNRPDKPFAISEEI